MTEITYKITQAKNKDDDDMRYGKNVNICSASYFDTAKWLTQKRLAKWMVKHDLFNLIFKELTHFEIIKRSAEILNFYYNQ